MGRLAVLALLVTAVSGFVPGARPLRTAPRAASRSTRTVRMAMVRIVFTIKPNGVVQEEVQGLNDEQHSRSGAVVIREEWFEAAPNRCFPEAWGQLPPGLGPAPRGWKSSWRTLFMP